MTDRAAQIVISALAQAPQAERAEMLRQRELAQMRKDPVMFPEAPPATGKAA